MEATRRLDERLADLAARGGFRGAARVEHRGAGLLDVAYGADADGVPLEPDTAFQVASVSKSFTAAAVLELCDRGAVSLDDELAARTAGAPDAWREITVRDLVAHTSGLPHWADLGDFDPYRTWTTEALSARLAEEPLRFRPGTGWHYSSPGYYVLASLVEFASGMPFAAFLDSEILEPRGLAATSAGTPRAGVAAARGSLGGSPARTWDPSLWTGTGSVWSTTADLARWPRSLDPARAFEPLVRIADEEDGLTDVGYAFGWFTGKLDGRRLVLHPGDQPGFTSIVVWAPDDDLAVVVLAADSIDLDPLVLPALRELLDEVRETPPRSSPAGRR